MVSIVSNIMNKCSPQIPHLAYCGALVVMEVKIQVCLRTSNIIISVFLECSEVPRVGMFKGS